MPGLKQHCAEETRACVQDDSGSDETSEEPSGDGSDLGTIPDELVGTWSTASTIADTYDPNTGTFSGNISGSGTAHHFGADGTWWKVQIIRTHYGCTSTHQSRAEGKAGVEGGVLTTYRTGGKSKTDTCGTVDRNQLGANRNRFRWRIEPSGNTRVLILDQIGDDYSVRLHYED